MQKLFIGLALLLSVSLIACGPCTNQDKAVIKAQNVACSGNLQCLAEKLASIDCDCIKEVLENGASTQSFIDFSSYNNIFNAQAKHNFERFENDLSFVGIAYDRPEVHLTAAEIILSIFIILCVVAFTAWAFWPQGKPFQQPIKELHH